VPFITKVPPLFVVTVVSAALLPMVLAKVVTPEVLTVRAKAPFTVLLRLTAPLPDDKIVSAPKDVTLPIVIVVSLVLIVPLRVTVLGAVATKPPVYVWVPPAWPKVRVPVLLKVTALVIVLAVPVKDALLTVLATVKLVGLTAPVKLAVPPMFCSAKVPVPLTVVPVISAAEVPAPVPVCRVKV